MDPCEVELASLLRDTHHLRPQILPLVLCDFTSLSARDKVPFGDDFVGETCRTNQLTTETKKLVDYTSLPKMCTQASLFLRVATCPCETGPADDADLARAASVVADKQVPLAGRLHEQ